MPTVKFIRSFALHQGPLYNRGDIATLSAEDAASAVRQACGVLVNELHQDGGQKSLSRPPKHKQMTAPRSAK